MKKILWLALVLVSCNSSEKISKATILDPHSFAGKSSTRVQHLSLDLTVNFDEKKLIGSATYQLAEEGITDLLYLDTKALVIESVVDAKSQEALPFEFEKEDSVLGTALKISLSKSCKSVTIKYSTTRNATALQWLEPSQTSGKKYPYLYTQSQAILARSWIPCQDGPGIRFTYDAKLTVPKNFIALMSAENPQTKNDSGIYTFKQEKAIPSYLMALVVGDIEFKALSANTGVYTERENLNACANEFTDIPAMMQAAEGLYGKYQWKRYDIIVLPPSFPFGGMENPELTFATPTIITGDRSLVNLVAHELAHSWSGNLVTNATWEDIWLNEGFTVYFERRITEQLQGKDYVDMLRILGFQDLQQEIESFGKESPNTKLALDLKGKDPDEGLSDIAYEKGALFLLHIENAVGRERFDHFLNEYFKSNAFGTTTTPRFEEYLETALIKGDKTLQAKINAKEWIHGTNLPADIPILTSTRLDEVDANIEKFLSSSQVDIQKTRNWSSHEWLYFIRGLKNLSNSQMEFLESSFNFSNSGNAELQCAWFLHVIENNYNKDYASMEEFLCKVGRRKFLMPIYAALCNTEEGKRRAQQIYVKAKPNYHYVSRASIEKLFGLI